MSNFGQYLKELRIKKEITLRRFCQENGFDPSFVSKVERNLLPPPKDETILKRYARALDLKEESDDWHEFIDKAQLERSIIPSDLLNEEVIKKLPLFCRSIRGASTAEDKTKILLDILKSA